MTTQTVGISVKQLRRAIRIKEKIEVLEMKLARVLGPSNSWPVSDFSKPKRKMSAAARRKIAAAQRVRWAKVKAAKAGK